MFLSCIGFVHGERRPTADLGGDGGSIAEDVPTYRESHADIWRLGAAAAAVSLRGLDGPAQLLVYATENDTDPTASVARLADAVGLQDAELLTVGGHECGNLGPALRVACDAVVAGRCERVLVVLADRAEAGDRLMVNGMSVLSDGAASCVVSKQGGPGPTFGIVAIVGRSSIDLDPDATPERVLMRTVSLARRSAGELAEQTGLGAEAYRHLVFGNYRGPSQRFLAAALRLPKAELLDGDVEAYGHCFSADILVTLHRGARDGRIAPGDRVLASAMGPHSWSSMSLVSA